MSATISTQIDAEYCNYHTIQLEGIDTVADETLTAVLQALIDA